MASTVISAPRSGLVSVFADEFDGSVTPDVNHSTWDTTLSGNVRYAMPDDRALYVDKDFRATDGSIIPVNPFSMQDGKLVISATQTPGASLADADNRPYISGAISTWQHQQFKYGYFEASIQTPGGKGTHPAFWLRTVDPSSITEIDILESIGGDNFRPYQTVHTDSATYKVGRTTQSFDMSKGFHKYGVDWQPDYITTYVDGVQTGRVATPEALKGVPMYLIANTAVGTGWAGQPDASTTWGQDLKIDYIRVWQDANSFVSVNKTGTVNAEKLAGNDAADIISGGGGNDTLFGAGGNDQLNGGDGNDRLLGGMGDDTLDGGLGADYLAGGLGNDTYIVNDGSTTFYETELTGHDTVKTNLTTYALSGYLEDLVYTGSAAFKGTGTNFGNLLKGGNGNDTFIGNGGNDTIEAGNGNDRIDAGAGADVIVAGHGQDVITAWTAEDRLDVTGFGFTSLSQVVSGATHNAAGQLVLHFGSDSLTFTNLTSTSQLTDANMIFANSGSTSGSASDPVAPAPAPVVEAATGLAGAKLTGTAQSEQITGTNGNDTVIAGNGNDVITSKSGNDKLYGNAGNDHFVFTARETGTDTIADFVTGSDHIDLHDFGLNFAALQMHDTAAGMQIDLGVEHVVVAAVHTLTASDFVF